MRQEQLRLYMERLNEAFLEVIAGGRREGQIRYRWWGGLVGKPNGYYRPGNRDDDEVIGGNLCGLGGERYIRILCFPYFWRLSVREYEKYDKKELLFEMTYQGEVLADHVTPELFVMFPPDLEELKKDLIVALALRTGRPIPPHLK